MDNVAKTAKPHITLMGADKYGIRISRYEYIANPSGTNLSLQMILTRRNPFWLRESIRMLSTLLCFRSRSSEKR